MEELRKYGLGATFAYAFLGTLNSCVMVAVSWPIFILRTGGSPIAFSPLMMNPKFLIYLSAVYFTYGSVTTPVLLVAATALAPAFNWVLTTLQERLGCPRWLTILALGIAYAIGFAVFLVLAVLAACAICKTPVWVV
eukprot:UN0641